MTVTSWSIVIPGRPRSKGNSKRVLRFGKRLVPTTSADVVAAENNAKAIAYAHRPPAPFEGPLWASITFVFAIPQSARERVSKRGKVTPATIEDGDPCTKRVDRGNCLKLIEDALEGVVYVDDSQIVDGPVRKVWGLVDETQVTIAKIVAAWTT